MRSAKREIIEQGSADLGDRMLAVGFRQRAAARVDGDQQMAAAYPQVLTSQRTLLNLQIAYLHALEKVWMNAVALQNYGLGGGLDQPMSSAGRMQNPSAKGND